MRRITDAQSTFATNPAPTRPRSTFDRSRRYMSAGDAGYLIPMFLDEAYPGDTFQINTKLFARMATPIHMPMDNLTVDVHFWAVPCRLLWDNWVKMHGEQENPTDSIDFEVPQISSGAGGFVHNGLADYLGLPPAIPNLSVSALPFRAYNKVYHDFYRDQNLIDAPDLVRTDTGDLVGSYPLQKRGKRHDFYTSCLPSPQKGAAVAMPLGGTAPVISAGDGIPSFSPGGELDVNSGVAAVNWTPLPGSSGSAAWSSTKLEADLQNATAATINAFREAVTFQQVLERSMRGGTRYPEQIKSFWGVTSPDHRMQRAEFLGGGSQRVVYNPVANQSAINEPVGELSAYGTSYGEDHRAIKTFDEHCIVLGIMSMRADLTYQQGVERLWLRKSRFDYYLPEFAHLGEQAVLSKEIFADGSANDEDVFGYQEAWADLRYGRSQLTSLFRSSNPASLDSWHLAQDFATRPVLGQTFIEEDVPMARINAVPTEPDFWFDSFTSVRCTRIMPVRSTPGLSRL